MKSDIECFVIITTKTVNKLEGDYDFIHFIPYF